jgi:hypothetical protein
VIPRRDVAVVFGLWLITAVGQASVGPAAEVTVVGGRVHIQATAVSISEVLNRLARTTGMKIVYDGPPPSDRLTAAIDAGSETEALSRLLEGLGLTYAFKLDAGGRHVETLFVTSSPSRRTASVTPAAASSRTNQFGGEDLEIGGTDAQDDPANDPAAVAVGMAMDPTSPGYVGGQPGGVPGVVPEPNPEFPSGASFPGPGSPPNPANPGFPSFPGPASYP